MSRPVPASPPPPTGVHLCVILHGLWGSPSHVAYLAESLDAHARPSAESDDQGERAIRLEVLVSKVNGVSAGHLYDGIDVCAERVVDEIDAEVERLQGDGAKVVKFSIVGYSLGGLVARYVLGLLDSRTPSFFSSAQPANFTTFASPWIGIPAYDSFWSRTFRYLGGRLLSRTGRQLYERDRFLPLRFADAEGDKKGLRKQRERVEAAPLLKVMADPRYSFYKGLSRFEQVDVFANIVNDRTVPFPTGGLESHDPFALARARAQEAAEESGESTHDRIDWQSGGFEITLYDDAPIVASYARTAPPSPLSKSSSTRPRRRLRMRLRLPTPFRPSTYPVSRPKALVVISLLPILWPLSIAFLASRSLVHAAQSSRRIRAARTKVGGGREGWLERVGILVGEIAEAAGGDNPEHAARLEGGADGRVESSGVRHGEEEKSTAATTASSSPGSSSARSASSSTALLVSTSSPAVAPTDADLSAALALGTDPAFSPAQLYQLDSLNALPQLRKHFVLLDAYFSHGAIVCRDRNFGQHQQGKEVVDGWAKRFAL